MGIDEDLIKTIRENNVKLADLFKKETNMIHGSSQKEERDKDIDHVTGFTLNDAKRIWRSLRSADHSIQQSPYEAKFGCKAKVGLSTSNLPREVVDNLVTEKDLENVEQEMEDAINAELPPKMKFLHAVAVEPLESLDRLPDNNNAKTFCVVYVKKSMVQPIIVDPAAKMSTQICHNKQDIRKKWSAAHASLQVQGAKNLKNADGKFPPAKIGDNVRIRIPDVDS
ncbi:hypothetical protein ILUMI_06293 [Ignelater luminosus]|uniref:Uncharacterized protein n=1 Tax=Ignelater luminosus TaxID=2038154 RepID=A0A8K0GJ84_IGNLU|nr:hypothetical protein ILUMI_06293 [Ignelater luminosus]